MNSKATTVEQYISELPAERREAITELRETVVKNLPDGYEEGMLYGMISYFVPLKEYPDTYNGQPLTYASIASQKNHMAIYLMGIYSADGQEEWFKEEYKKSGKKLDMGKSCVRFKKIDDLPLSVIGKAIGKLTPKQFIELYESSRKQ